MICALPIKRRVLIEKLGSKLSRLEVELFLEQLLITCKLYVTEKEKETTIFFVKHNRRKKNEDSPQSKEVILEIQLKREVSVFVNEFGLKPIYCPYSSPWGVKNNIRYSIQALFSTLIPEKHIPYIKIDRTSNYSFVFKNAVLVK